MKFAATVLATACLFQAGSAQALDITVKYCSNNERADIKVNVFNGSDTIRFAPSSSGSLRPGEARLYSCKEESCGFTIIYPINLPRPAPGNMSNLANGATLEKLDDRGQPTDSPKLCFRSTYNEAGTTVTSTDLSRLPSCTC